MQFFKKLIGDRIYLSPRSSGEEVVEKFTEWLNDFRVTDYIGKSGALITIDAEKKYFENVDNDPYVFFIIRKEDDKLIGTVGLHNMNLINRCATLGIFIGEESGRDKGVGTEAIKMILEYGFKYLNLNNIKLDVLGFNERAIACYKKCGFKEYGRRRESEFLYGKYYDRIEMDILNKEFEGDYIRNKNVT